MGRGRESPRAGPKAEGVACRAHLHPAEDRLALLPHVGEGAPLGQHEQAGQRLAQPVPGGGHRQPVGGRPGGDALCAAEHGLPDGVQGGGAGGGVPAAQPVPAHLALPLLHGAARPLLPRRSRRVLLLSSLGAAAPWRAPGSRQPAHTDDDERGRGERRARCPRRMGGQRGPVPPTAAAALPRRGCRASGAAAASPFPAGRGAATTPRRRRLLLPAPGMEGRGGPGPASPGAAPKPSPPGPPPTPGSPPHAGLGENSPAQHGEPA